MKIRYILGGTGYGKSYYLYQNVIKEAEKDLSKKYYFIVPDQVNLQVQRELVKKSSRGCIMNVDVLSFLRLAHRTFDEEGVKEKLVLEDTGKNMVVRKLLNKLAPEFKYFKKVSKKSGFTEEMKSLITELMQYRMEEGDIDSLLDRKDLSPVIKAKLHDTKLIYSAFQEYKKDKYIVAEKLLDLLADVLMNSELYRDAIFVFDGFTGFTPTQFAVITSLMRKARGLYFSFTIDKETYYEKETPDYKLFHLSKKMILKLNEVADRVGAEILSPVFVPAYKDKGAIGTIEERIFRFQRKKALEDGKNQVSVTMAKNPKEEIEIVLMKILSLVRDEGYRYREIGVVTGDMEEYGEKLYALLRRREVPAFLDRKKNIIGNPFVEFIRASLLVVEENFSYEAVMRYLRSGFSGIRKSGVDIFENFILAKGIKGKKRYSASFLKKDQLEKKSEIEKAEIETVEYIRKKIYSHFSPLHKVIKSKKKNVKEKTLALYQFIKLHRAEEKLYVMSQKFKKEGEELLSKEYSKCYEIVMDILEKMVELLGDEIFDTEDFSKVLEAGFLEGKAGLLPSGLDEVMIGDIKRTRFSGIKVLFILGLNEGKIPKTQSKKGILTDREREKLLSVVELAPTAREKAFMELFYLYMMFSLPSEKLILSYSVNGTDGKRQRPSYLVDKVLSLFEKKRVDKLSENTELIQALRKDGGRGKILSVLREGKIEDRRVLGLIRYYSKEKSSLFLDLMRGLTERPIGERLDRELALKLYGELKGSITRLECFTICPFSHFLSYGLRLEERKEFELQSFQLGNIYHEILERFSKKAVKGFGGFCKLTDSDRKKLLEESLKETVDEAYEIFSSSERNQYRLKTIRRIADKTVWALIEQVKAGDFLPTYFEEGFLSEKMRGRIDRIDTALSDSLPDGSLLSLSEKFKGFSQVEYARVIDYKSGKKDFDMNDTYYGLDFQLIAYLRHLSALLRGKPGHEKNLILPAGAYYYRIEDPVRKKGEGENSFLKELRLNGLTIESPVPLYLADHQLCDKAEDKISFSPSKKSNVIKVETKKDGELSATSAVYSIEETEDLMKHSENLMKEKRKEILSGEVRPRPYKMEDRTGCDFCKYESICRFGAKLPGYSYRKLPKLSKTEIFNRIRGNDGKKMDEGTE